MDTVTFGIRRVMFTAISSIVLLYSGYSFSSASLCNNFGLKNVNNGGRDWGFINFTGSSDCVLCFQVATEMSNNNPHSTENNHYPDLMLPCMDMLLHSVKRQVHIVYRLVGPAIEGLRIDGKGERSCQNNYSSGTNISTNISSMERSFSDLKNREMTLVSDYLNLTMSYRLKLLVRNTHPIGIVCLTNVTFTGVTEESSTTPSDPSSSEIIQNTTLGIVTQQASTSPSSYSSPERNQEATLEKVTAQASTSPTSHSPSQRNQKITQGSTQIEGGTSGTEPHTINNMEAQKGRRGTSFLIWVVLAIVVIVTSISVITGAFTMRRKQKHQKSTNDERNEKENDQSNGIRYNTNGDNGAIPNLTYGVGEETFNEIEGEYHSYAEIDAKQPNNSKMIYNSAYESSPTSRNLVHNCAYESQEISDDMIYNSAYESSTAN